MALIKCHECSRQVSDHALTCPHCGAPVMATIKRRQKAALIGLGIRLAFAAMFIVVVMFMLLHLKQQVLAPLKKSQQQQSH